jgi:hypothetical protein
LGKLSSSLGALVALAVLVCAPVARAQGSYHTTPTGGRSALVGGTGVALASDGSSPFLNPATIVRIHDASLAFSVNFFSISVTRFGEFHQPGGVDTGRFGALALPDTSVSATRFEVLPSTLCLFFTVAGWGDPRDAAVAPELRAFIAPRTGRQKLAACLGTTEQQSISLPALTFRGATPGGTTHTAQSFTESWRRVHLGPSYGIDLTEALTVGVSLHGVFTSYGFAWASSAITSDVSGRPLATSLNAAGDGRSIDLDAIFGATYRLEPLTVGLSVKPPAIHVNGAYDASFQQQTVLPDGAGALLATGTGDFRAPPPARIGLGVGANLRRLKVEADTTYYFPLERAIAATLHVDTTTVTGGTASTSAADVAYASSARPVVNTAVGAEYFLRPSLSFLAGAATDVSSVAELSLAPSLATFHEPRISRLALSLGLGSYGEAGTILVGTQLSMGWGQTVVVNPYTVPNGYAAVDARNYGATFVIAGSTNLRALRGAVESVRDLVRP